MLCSETATGSFPVESLVTASRICRNAEAAMNYSTVHSFIRDFSAKPFNTIQAAAVAVAKACTDAQLELVVVVSDSGEAARVVTKYRPSVPLIVITSQAAVAANCALNFGQRGMLVEGEALSGAAASLTARAVEWAKNQGIYKPGRIAVMHGGSKKADISNSAMIEILSV
jgi:pyruvate kinase